jgi:hypothetical protein
MDCQAVQQNDVIEDYLRHRLDEGLSDELETHLLGCPDCTRFLEYMQSLRDGLEERASSIRTPASKQRGFLSRLKAIASYLGRVVRVRSQERPLRLIDEEPRTLSPRAFSAPSPKVPKPDWRQPLLASWTEIASYLGREVQDVLRSEKFEGLPVHRTLHVSGCTVYAYKHEIDAWVRRRSQTPSKVAAQRLAFRERLKLLVYRDLHPLDAVQAAPEEKTEKPDKQ